MDRLAWKRKRVDAVDGAFQRTVLVAALGDWLQYHGAHVPWFEKAFGEAVGWVAVNACA